MSLFTFSSSSMPDPEKPKKKLWEFDPSLYTPGSKAGVKERTLGWLRTVGKAALYVGFFAYPLALPIIGVVFGGLVFWAAFGGSVAVISVILARLGFARIFAKRDFPFLTSTIALCGGFLCALGFYLSLFTLQWWIIPIVMALGSLGLLVALRSGS
jgi:hypothetical protein